MKEYKMYRAVLASGWTLNAVACVASGDDVVAALRPEVIEDDPGQYFNWIKDGKKYIEIKVKFVGI